MPLQKTIKFQLVKEFPASLRKAKVNCRRSYKVLQLYGFIFQRFFFFTMEQPRYLITSRYGQTIKELLLLCRTNIFD